MSKQEDRSYNRRLKNNASLHANNPEVQPEQLVEFYEDLKVRVGMCGQKTSSMYETLLEDLERIKECLTKKILDKHTYTAKQDVFVGDRAAAVTGSNSCSISGNLGVSVSEHESVSASNIGGVSVSAGDSVSISDDYGISVSGAKGVSFTNCSGVAISRAEGKSSASNHGIALSGHRGLSESGCHGISISGIGGVCSAGEGGILISKFVDPSSMEVRIICAYVGCNGIEPEKTYTVKNGRFVAVDVDRPNLQCSLPQTMDRQ